MTDIFSAYAPIEVLLLFHHLAVHGITSSFVKVSESLEAEPLVQTGHNYNPDRLDPDALKHVFLRLLKEEARNEIQKAADEDEGNGSDGQAGRKRKATSPPLASTADAIRDQHLIPQLVLKLYARYRDQAVSEIREIEQRHSSLVTDVKEIEQGRWDARLQEEIRQGKWTHLAARAITNGTAQSIAAKGSTSQLGPAASTTSAKQSGTSTPSLQSAPTANPRDPRSKSPMVAQGQARPSPAHPTVLIPQPHPTPAGQVRPQAGASISAQLAQSRPPVSTPGATTPRPSLQYTPQLGTAQTSAGQIRPGLPHGHSPVSPYPYSQPPTSSASVAGPYATQPQRSTPATPAAGTRTPNVQQHASQSREARGPPHARGMIMQPFEVGPQMPRGLDRAHEVTGRSSQTGSSVHGRQTGEVPAGATSSSGDAVEDKSVTGRPRGPASTKSARSTPVRPQELNRRSTLPPHLNSQVIRNEVVRLLGTPNSSRASSVVSTPARTPWRVKPMETRVANHRSPSPMRERSISPIQIEPLSTADNLTASNTPSTMMDLKMDLDHPATRPTPATTSVGRGGRGRRRGRGGRGGTMAGSRTSSVTGASTRGRTRSQSIMSQASTTNNDQRNVKAEPSTPADASDMDFTRSMETPASDRKAKNSSQLAVSNPMKRKRALRGASEDTHEGGNRYPSSNIVVRPNEVIAVKNFPRLCASVLQNISTHKHASLFANPVRPKDAEGYTEIIKRPTDLKTIKSAISAGARAVTAATAELTAQAAQGTPTGAGAGRRASVISTTAAPSLPISLSTATSSSSREASTFLLPISEDLVPPKGIVNSAQLEKELMRMLANAVMFNPGEEGVVAYAREMYEAISREIAGFRSAERMGGVAERSRRGAGKNEEDDEDEGEAGDEGEELGTEVAGEGNELRVSKRRRG